jgi:hypothetical protein
MRTNRQRSFAASSFNDARASSKATALEATGPYGLYR